MMLRYFVMGFTFLLGVGVLAAQAAELRHTGWGLVQFLLTFVLWLLCVWLGFRRATHVRHLREGGGDAEPMARQLRIGMAAGAIGVGIAAVLGQTLAQAPLVWLIGSLIAGVGFGTTLVSPTDSKGTPGGQNHRHHADQPDGTRP